MAASDKLGRTPLHYAACEGRVDAVADLLAHGADSNAQDHNGWSPLHFAAQANAPECARLLLSSGANVEARDAFGNTVLFRAVFASHGEGAVISLLLDAGADPYATNHHGISPLFLARTIANYDVARFFTDLD